MAPQVVEVPKWIIALRAAQIVLAVIILGMASYGVYWIHFNVRISREIGANNEILTNVSPGASQSSSVSQQ
jgi:hypothetical protein